MQYLVTTNKARLPEGPIAMIDGTVPGFIARDCDIHFDHHRPNGDKVQLTEIPDDIRVSDDVTFVTTMVDADACAAAAWLQLLTMDLDPVLMSDARTKLIAIAYDCDHLGLPVGTHSEMTEGNEWDAYREFARNAVAALKLEGESVVTALTLPADRKTWTAEQKESYASECFRLGSEWLVQAVLGHSKWPGENGEAEHYWKNVEAMRPYVKYCSKLINGYAVLDQRSLSAYCDPRLLVEWAREREDHKNVTLTVRDRLLKLEEIQYRELRLGEETWATRYELAGYELQGNESLVRQLIVPAYNYTLGSIPLHENGSPMFSDNEIWKALTEAEKEKRKEYGYPMPSTNWGGRNEVGGSSHNDAVILTPEEVLTVVHAVLV